MKPIDRPFRFTWDFCAVWALLVAPVFVLAHRSNFGPWYSLCAIAIVGPLIAAFFIYGPVLLMRQVIHSGSRGWFILRTFLSIVLAATLLFGALYFSGTYTESRARVLAFVFTAAATGYLSWRTESR
jgi:hypothetical protein